MNVIVHSKQVTPCQVIWSSPKQQSPWEWIINNWNVSCWAPIPQWVKDSLKLHPALGVCSGMLITKASASGLDEFIQKVNRR